MFCVETGAEAAPTPEFEQLRAAFDLLSTGIASLDGDGAFLAVNAACCAILAYQAAELIGRPLLELLHADDAPGFRAAHERARRGEAASLRLELRFLRPDGREVWGLIKLAVVRDPGGGLKYLIAELADITERKGMEQSLRESEERFRLAFESAGIGMALLAIDGRWLRANRGICEMLGYSEAELRQTSYQALSHPDDLIEGRDDARRVVSGEIPWMRIEKRYRHRAGHYVWARLTTSVVRSVEGEPLYYVSQIEDISGHKQIQERLALVDFALGRVQEAAYLVDQQAAFHYVNDEACRALGYSREELLGMRVPDIDPDWPLQQVIDCWHEVKARTALTFETRHRARNGRIFPVEINATHLAYAGRDYNLVLVRDITERKRLEVARQESEQRYREIFDSSLDALFLLEVSAEGDLRTIEVNPAFEKAVGRSRAQLVGRAIEQALPPEAAPGALAKCRRCVASGLPLDEELELELPAGRRTLHATLIPVRDESGRVHRLVGITRDISARKHAEHLLRDLSSRRETAREEERKRIAREIHDELGQQLTALRMGISLLRLQFGAANPLLVERVQGLMGLADKSIQVVRDVAASLRPASLDMGLASALEWLVAEFAQHSGLDCRLRLPPEKLLLDDERATAAFRVVQESLTNVARHARASRVEISLAHGAGHFLLEVRDDGQGFDPAAPRQNAFGLVGMRERGLMLGGEVSILSAPGQGTLVRVRIPIRETLEET